MRRRRRGYRREGVKGEERKERDPFLMYAYLKHKNHHEGNMAS